MQPPVRQPVATRVLFRYVRWLAARRFTGVVLREDPPWVGEASAFPAVLAGTHTSWWDGLAESLLFERWGLSYAVLMEERNLARYPFFRRTGVTGVDLDSVQGRAAGFRRVLRWVRDDDARDGATFPARAPLRRVVVLFPHGRIVQDLDPSAWPPLEAGAERLASLAGGRVVPYAKRVVGDAEPKPSLFVAFGEPLAEGGDLGGALREADAGLRRWVASGAPGGVVLAGRRPDRDGRGGRA